MKFDGFNGQARRKEIFKQLLALARPELIIETGTCEGETTGYMAETSGLNVLTCEAMPERVDTATQRLKYMNVQVVEADSRAFLRAAAKRHSHTRTLFYLDAHWDVELPLTEELNIIFGSWPDFVVMIDDFKIDDDPGYGFDDYTNIDQGIIGMELISKLIRAHNVPVFFPVAKSDTETGAKRGSAYICSRGPMEKTLAASGLIRKVVP